MRDDDLLKLFLDLASANGLDQYIHLDDPDQQAILQEICTLLDGYPLGAELIFGATHSINGRTFAPEAATRSLAEIRNELRSTPLPGILAVLDVSYRRLSLIARLLLAYLSTFNLPFSSEQIAMLVAPETSASTGDAIRLIRQQDMYQDATAAEEKIFPAELANNWQAARAELVHASFMQFDGRVYTIHPQVRHFAISHLSMEERRRVHRLVAKYYATSPQPSPEEWLAAVEHLESAGEAQDLQEAVQVAVRASRALDGRGHAQELLVMLRRASVHASRFGDKVGEGQIQCCLGAILRQLGQFAEAEACLRSSLDFYKEQQTRIEEGWSLYQLAMLFREEGNFRQANTYAQEAQTLFRELGDAKGEAWMQTVLSEIRRGTGAYYDAFGHVNDALISFTSLHNKEGIASALRDRGTIYEAMGKYAEASDDYSEALHIFNELGLRSSQAWVLTDKSIILAHLGKLDEAEKKCLEAIAIFREQGMRRGEAWALRALGDIKHYLHDYEQARAYFMKAMVLLTTLGCRVDLARVSISLGAIEFHENEFIAAQEQYEQAHMLVHEQGAKQLEGHALRGLGDVARVMRYYDEAEHRYTAALTIATDLDTPAEECAVVYRLGLLHEAQGHFRVALDHFVHALALDVRLGHPSLSELQTHIECMVKEHQLEEAYTTFCKQHNLGC